MPNPAAIPITNAEWEVMTVAWDRSPVEAAVITEQLHHQKRWSLATVRTLLRRLVNKGVLAHRQEGKKYVYTPRVSIEECVRWETESFLERVLHRASPSAILHLVEKTDLSKEDIRELKRILRQKEDRE